MTVALVSDNSVPSSLVCGLVRAFPPSDYAPTELPVWPVGQGPSSARALTLRGGLAGLTRQPCATPLPPRRHFLTGEPPRDIRRLHFLGGGVMSGGSSR